MVINGEFVFWDRIVQIKFELLEEITRIKPAGVIIGKLDSLREFGPVLSSAGIKVVASSLFAIKNCQAIDFFIQNLRIDSVILDCQIKAEDLRQARQEFPGFDFEVFVFSGGCWSLASACNYTRIVGKHSCFYPFTAESNKKVDLSAEDKEVIGSRLSIPGECCGACTLYYFKKYNINIRAYQAVSRQ
ncbi:MAG: U32 family peptidase [Desulfovibrionales bacterium]